ncbi:MAG: hypothetical protein VXB01_03480, partial [Opitutae bacterium]
MSKLIDSEGFYVGPEVQWSVQDVEMITSSQNLGVNESDLERVLIATFQDNEYLMTEIHEAIK